jgi:hypothetical protein
MKRTTYIGALALLTLFFFSCGNGGNAGNTPDKVPAPGSPDAYHGGGHSVPWAQVEPCLKAYPTTMQQYGLTTNNPRIPITQCADSTYLITLSETFRADSLIAWMQAQINLYDSAAGGANLNFTVMPGIRTGTMLASVGEPTTTAGRITLFLLPQKGSVAGKVNGGDPGSGFEVGGLQP